MAPNDTTQEILGLAELQRAKVARDEPTLSDLPVVPSAPRRVAQRPSKAPKPPRTAPRPNWLLYGAVVAACGFLGWAGATLLTAPASKPYKAPVAAVTPSQVSVPSPTLSTSHRPRHAPPAHHPRPTPKPTHAHPTARPTPTPRPKPSHSVKPKPSPTTVSTPPPNTSSPGVPRTPPPTNKPPSQGSTPPSSHTATAKAGNNTPSGQPT